MALTLDLQSFRLPNGDDLVLRLSTGSDGAEGNSYSAHASLSADGRYLVFESLASNLVDGDTNNRTDIFRKDLQTGEVALVSRAAAEAANDQSGSAQVSANGRYVLFQSSASNLVAGDTNGRTDLFRKDLETGIVIRVSTSGDGSEISDSYDTATLSADGRYVYFESQAGNLVAGDSNNAWDVFRKDLETGEITLLSTAANGSQANGGSFGVVVSADGRYAVFESDADNLVAGDTNGSFDIFRKDLVTGEVMRVSVSSDGSEANGSNSSVQVSADGRYIVFESDADNLVAGDTNGGTDIFRKDMVTGEIVRVSTASGGLQANRSSNLPQISADGRYVVFESDADNLVAGDTNGATDIFRKDMATGETVLLSTTTRPAQGPEEANGGSTSGLVSSDGRFVFFWSTASNLIDGDLSGLGGAFRKDVVTGEVLRISTAADGAAANSSSGRLAGLSADGRYVFFNSGATNLVPGDINGRDDVFRKDLQTGEIVLVSIAQDGTQANSRSYCYGASADGRYVVFESDASNLVPIDSNGRRDIFRKDLTTGAVEIVSTASDGSQGDRDSYNATTSADGRYILFDSGATNLVAGDTNNVSDVFLKDMFTGATTRLSESSLGLQGNGYSANAIFSADGNFVFFSSLASNLVAGDTNNRFDIFRKDLSNGETIRVSTASDGTEANVDSGQVAVSADGRYIVFSSGATNLVGGDTNGCEDVFRKDLQTGEVVRVSTSSTGEQGNTPSATASISSDGRYVTFTSAATNLVTGDTNGIIDVFRKDLVTGELIRISTADRDATGNEGANSYSQNASLRPDGRFVLFESSAGNLVSGDTNESSDIFLVDTDIAHLKAMQEGRFASLTFGVGAASSVEIAWGDGTTEVGVPASGVVNLRHAYDSRGTKSAILTVHEGEQTWSVPYRIDLVNGAAGRDTSVMDTLLGGSGADRLDGDAYANVIIGNAGNDTIDGGAGADRMEGGAGDDTYYVDNADDVVLEAAGGGHDTAIVSLDFHMDRLANVEVLKLADGSTAVRATGGAGADHLIGNGAFNILDGGAGADTLEGGAGSDVYLVDNAGDVVIEAAGGGADAVQTSVSFALSDSSEIEFLTALGSSALALTGNALANTLSGNGGANVLHGMGGNDRAFGGAGADRLYGDAGNDTLGGGAGHDRLTGGTGRFSRDMFVFDTKLTSKRVAKANLDKITDFGPKYDAIGFDDAAFTNRTIANYVKRKGDATLDHALKISKSWFRVGDKALDRNDFFIYNDKTHTLYFDADGSGHKAMVAVTTFGHFERHAGATLTYKDLFLV